ncbi:hypothetical protein [Chitinophaga sp. 212800010-3]|uniref:hypothetical protein n=1 Tax=unclassified Chitinophaga TaxID=2619133 RepID=UPI002DF1DEB6|nr:YXWGXW repeat-containing protein [Chitinophaga sp. 212800010-3]
MKKITLVAILFIAGLYYAPATTAQVRLNVNVNIGNQPLWGPVGYDHAEYYYMPDIDAYYSVPQRQFIYYNDDRWIFAPSLPPRYNYDLYRGYKVVINESRPYLRDDYYRREYGRYKGWYGKQDLIRDSRDERYRKYNRGNDDNQGKGHWKENGHDNGHGYGRGHKHGEDD